MSIYVLSKLANTQCYTKWAKGSNSINTIVEKIEIKGGADVINKKTLDTPSGVVTIITKEQLEILKENPDFMAHVEKGFISYHEEKITEEVKEEKAAKMPKDNSRQKTKKDYKKSKGKAKPVKKNDEEEEDDD